MTRCRHCREIVEIQNGRGWIHSHTNQRECGPSRGAGFTATPNMPRVDRYEEGR